MKELSIIKKNYINYIDKIIENGHISHAYLFEIDNYEDDFSYIVDFIKMILCNISYEKVKESSNSIINLIDNNNYPDIKIIEPDGSTIKKSQLLDLQKDYSNKSLLDGKRIYVIKNAEKLNPASANTILKFLEEPEDDIIAILVTDNRYHVIDTIISRCQIITIKEDNLLFSSESDIIELLNGVIKPRSFYIGYNHFINDILIDKSVAIEKFRSVENILVSYLNYKYLGSDNFDKEIVSILENISNEQILNCLSILEEELPKLEFNVNFKLWIDSLFSKMTIGGENCGRCSSS